MQSMHVICFHNGEQQYIASGNQSLTHNINEAHVFSHEGLINQFGDRLYECKDIVLIETDRTPTNAEGEPA